MSNAMQELIKRVHQLTEEQAAKAVEAIDRIIEEDDTTDEKVTGCPHCGSSGFVRNGRKNGKQRYKCKSCQKTFVYTAESALQGSHFGEAVWKQVINDTLEGKSLDKTAESLGFSHATAFNMRHKILSALELYEQQSPTVLSGICEVDDTYVLESYKGKKLADDFWRKPRKHGAVAQKRGLSREYVSIQAGVMRGGKIYTKVVNRATPSSENVKEAFSGHIQTDALVLCDGAKSYAALSDTCEIRKIDTNEVGEFAHINNVNGYHSYVKERYIAYRGVATKYLNRYSILFSKGYHYTKSLADSIYNILCSNNPDLYRPVRALTVQGLLDI